MDIGMIQIPYFSCGYLNIRNKKLCEFYVKNRNQIPSKQGIRSSRGRSLSDSKSTFPYS